MVCRKCGSEVTEDAVFCTECGEKIEHLCPHCGAAVDEDDVFCTACGERIARRCCPSCGSELDEESKFCIFCGAQVDGTQEVKPRVTEPKRQASQVSMQKQEPKKGESTHNDTKMAWAIGALVILIAVVAIICLGNGMDDTAKDKIAKGGYLADEPYDDAEEYLLESEDFDDSVSSPWTEEDEAALNEYIFPDSDYEYLQRWELEGLSKEDLKIARNEIYARHGRMFQDAGLQAYFNSCSWYTPSIAPEDFKESMLNEVEIANRDMIVAYEKEMGYR